MPVEETKARIRQVLRVSLKLGADASIPDDMPLIGGEYDLDSLDILLLVTNIEKEFQIKIDEKAIGRDAFKTLASLAAFVETQRA